MGKYGFWILLAACLLAIAALYVIEVKKSEAQLRDQAVLATTRAAQARELAKSTVGRASLDGLREAQKLAGEQIRDMGAYFRDRDERNFDCWFPELERPWKSAPRPEQFQREHDLAVDRLGREVRRLLAAAGVPDKPVPIASPPPIEAEDFPDPKALGAELRRRQHDFWVQDHLLLAFARQGAWPARPIRGGDSIGFTVGSGGETVFERLRYDIEVYADPTRVLDVLHAFDSPFVHVTEEGQRIDVAIDAVVDNVAIRVPDLDEKLVETFGGRPPVLVSFYLTVLDFEPRARD